MYWLHVLLSHNHTYQFQNNISFTGKYSHDSPKEELIPVFPHSNNTDGLNHMPNYTFYSQETSLIFVGNIASAALVVVGVVSNFLCLGVLDAGVFLRTSFRVYLQWVCWYHLLSLVLACLRHHTFLLDFEDGTEESVKQRLWGCVGLLWFVVEVEHTTTASLTLLCWNRIWAQRNFDRADTEEDAMRNPVLLNFVVLLFAMFPTSNYIEAFVLDAFTYGMSKCSFSFVHPYGAPRLQAPFLYNITMAGEGFLLLSLLILVIEMIMRSMRMRTGRRVRLSDLFGHFVLTPDEISRRGTFDGYGEEAASKRPPKDNIPAKGTSFTTNLHRPKSRLGYEDRDRSMTHMTVVYLLMYLIMGMPSRLAPYLLTNKKAFPLVMMLSLLRKAFHAGTILYLYMGSNLMKETIANLAGQLPAVQYTSSTALFEPDAGGNQDPYEIGARMSTRYNMRTPEQILSTERFDTQLTNSLTDTSITPGHLDKLELGVTQAGHSPSRAVVMSMRSPSQVRFTPPAGTENAHTGPTTSKKD